MVGVFAPSDTMARLSIVLGIVHTRSPVDLMR